MVVWSHNKSFFSYYNNGHSTPGNRSYHTHDCKECSKWTQVVLNCIHTMQPWPGEIWPQLLLKLNQLHQDYSRDHQLDPPNPLNSSAVQYKQYYKPNHKQNHQLTRLGLWVGVKCQDILLSPTVSCSTVGIYLQYENIKFYLFHFLIIINASKHRHIGMHLHVFFCSS